MKKIGMLLAVLALFVSMGAVFVGHTGVASAAPRDDNNPEFYFGGRPWLRESIVHAAADTIAVSPDDVRYALHHGETLADLGRDHGIREDDLAAGIITNEHNIFENWQDNGRINREQRAYGNWFVETHIWFITHTTFNPDPY